MASLWRLQWSPARRWDERTTPAESCSYATILSVLGKLGLFEFKGQGSFYTWANKQKGNTATWSWLNRFFGNTLAIQLQREITTKVIGTVSSDHCALHIILQGRLRSWVGRRLKLLRTEPWWFTYGECADIVNNSWVLPVSDIHHLRQVQKNVKLIYLHRDELRWGTYQKRLKKTPSAWDHDDGRLQHFFHVRSFL